MMTNTAVAVAAEGRGDEASRLVLSAPGLAVSSAGDWFALLKPRVVALVVFTGLVGLLVAPGHLHPVLAFAAVLCIAVAAGAAGRIAPAEALGFGVTLAVASVLVMWLVTNVFAAAVLALSIAFYVFVYTI